METPGHLKRIQNAPGLFLSNIEIELQYKSIDIAVHALKDMPALETKGLKTDSFLERNDPREILITTNKKKLSEEEKQHQAHFFAQRFTTEWRICLKKASVDFDRAMQLFWSEVRLLCCIV